MDVILYHTSGCHLCEEAKKLYQQLGLTTQLMQRDIAFDEDLFKGYGVTIPVISLQKSTETQASEVIDELFWPFDLEKLKNWTSKHGVK